MKDNEASGKHVTLRVILFILALVVGIGAFGIGIYHIVNRETGYYEIKATADETAPLYAKGYTFYCYIDGKSDEIKSNMTKLGSLYSESLGRISRLLDAEQTYDGYINLATLNRRPNEDVVLPAELYEALADALKRTEGTGFSICSGTLRALWQELLYLEEPGEFDPAYNADQAERMQAVKEALLAPDAVRLELSDEQTHSARITVSDAYRAVLERCEIEAPFVDLDVLRDAYALRYVYRKLTENGVAKGYLKTERGLCIMLPETENGAVTIFGQIDGKPVHAAELSIGHGDACCVLRSFSLGEAGYYETDGILRHPWPGPEAEPNRQLLTAWSVSRTGDIVGATLNVLTLYAAPYDELRALPASLATKQTSVALIAADAPQTILVDAQHETEATPDGENGYTVTVP